MSKSKKARCLTAREKETLTNRFLLHDGRIDKAAAEKLHDELFVPKSATKNHPLITVSQTTGYITHLHQMVAEGSLPLRDFTEYNEWIQEYQPELHKMFWSPKKVALRKSSGVNYIEPFSSQPNGTEKPLKEIFRNLTDQPDLYDKMIKKYRDGIKNNPYTSTEKPTGLMDREEATAAGLINLNSEGGYTYQIYVGEGGRRFLSKGCNHCKHFQKIPVSEIIFKERVCEIL